MEIRLKKLSFRNFKGIKELDLDFHQETNIFGDNASGKTTIFDGFSWLLFGKDSNDRTAFNIKTLDSEGNVIHGIEHEVEGALEVNGKPLTLKKVYKENWTKRRGEAERLLTGHTTSHWINEEPVRKKDYTEKVESFASEDIFKLITNPFYFNTHMKWLERRKLLEQIIGDVDDAEIVSQNKELEPLDELLSGRSLESFKKIISSKRKELNDEIKAIPIRIDELHNSLPSLDVDFKAIEKELKDIQSKLTKVEADISSGSKHYEDIAKQNELLYEKKLKMLKIENKAEAEKDKPLQRLKSKLEANKYEVSSKENLLKSREDRKISLSEELEAINESIKAKRAKWHEVNKETLEFDQDEFVCPTCNRELEQDDIESKKKEINQNFIDHKAKKIESINNEGLLEKERSDKLTIELNELALSIEEQTKELVQLNKTKERLTKEIEDYKPVNTLEDNKEYLALKEEVKAIEESIKSTTVVNAVKELELEKNKLLEGIGPLKAQLATKEQYKKTNLRIDELKEKEKALGGQIAKLEGQEFLCEEFVRKKIEYLESRINSRFEMVTFKLFNTLVNGSIEECCETLIDGVPYSDANTAGQVNAGIDIINTLSKHFEVSAPIFVDNREGVVELQKADAQVINLRVGKVDTTKEKYEEFKGTNNKKLYTEVI